MFNIIYNIKLKEINRRNIFLYSLGDYGKSIINIIVYG